MTSWYLAPALHTLRSQIDSLWPLRDRTSDGSIGDAAHASRVSAHNPDADGSVNAIDIDVDGIDLVSVISTATVDSRTALIISNGRYWRPSTGWRTYTGINPHNKHVHIEVWHDSREDDPSLWLGLVPKPTPASAPLISQEDDRMIALARQKDDPRVYVGDGVTRRHVQSETELKDLQYIIATGVLKGTGDVRVVDRIEWLGKEI